MAGPLGEFEVPVDVPVNFKIALQQIVQDLNKVDKLVSDAGSDLARSLLKEMRQALKDNSRGVVTELEDIFKKFGKLIGQTFEPNSEGGKQATAGMRKLIKQLVDDLGGNKQLEEAFSSILKGSTSDADQIFDKATDRFEKFFKDFKGIFDRLENEFGEWIKSSKKGLESLLGVFERFVGQETVLIQEGMQTRKIDAKEREHQRKLEERAELHKQRKTEERMRRYTDKLRTQRRMEVADHAAALKEDNLVLNAYLQQQVVRTKESLDRRQQLQRFFLDSTRSTFRAASSAIDNIWQASFRRLGTIFTGGEDRLTSAAREGSRRRQSIYDLEAKNRGQTMSKFQQQADSGVIGAAAGTSIFGGNIRQLAALGGGAFGLSSIFRLGSDFTEQLNVTAALTNATKKEFEALQKASLDLGNDITLPGISARDAAESMGMLARSGFGVRDSIDAAKGVLSLARGAQLDFGQASEIVGKSLGVFGIKAKDATQIADAFTGALAMAPQSISDIEKAVARGGGTFMAFQKNNATSQENLQKYLATTSSLIKLTGRSGEEVGTGFKRFFEVFQNPTGPAQEAIKKLSKAAGVKTGNILFDANGKVREFSETVDLLKTGVGNLGTEQERVAVIGQIFGSDASSIAMALASENFQLDDAVGNLRRMGDSAKLAAARNQGLKGALDALKSQFETFAILIYMKVNKPLGAVVTAIATLIDKIANGGGAFAILRKGLLGAAAGIGALLAVKGVIELFGYLKIALGAVISPMGLLAVLVAGAGAAFAIAYKKSEAFREFIEGLKIGAIATFENIKTKVLPVLKTFADRLVAFGKKAIGPVVDFMKSLWKQVAKVGEILDDSLIVALGAVLIYFEKVKRAFNGEDISGVFGVIGRAARTAYNFVKGAFDGMVKVALGAVSLITAGWEAGGIVGVFKSIAQRIAKVFSDINWGNAIVGVLAGINRLFAALGRRIGLILGSNEFRNTVLVVLGTIGAVVGSALVGLVEGFVDGLRKSELGKSITGAIKKLINPVEIIKSLFGLLTLDPSSIAGLLLRGGLLAAIGIVVAKVKGAFDNAARATKLGFQFAFGDKQAAAEAAKSFRKMEQESEKAKAKIRSNIEGAFGTGPLSKFVIASSSVGRGLETVSRKISTVTQRLSNMGKQAAVGGDPLSNLFNRMSQTVSEGTSRINDRLREGTGRFKQFLRSGYGEALQSEAASLLTAATAAGAGIAGALVADSLQGQIAGVTSAIGGIAYAYQIAKAASVEFSIAAGLATGGITIALTAVTAALSFFAMKQQKAREEAQKFKDGVKSAQGVLSDFTDETGFSGRQFELEFAKRIASGADDSFEKLRTLGKQAGFTAEEISVAFSSKKGIADLGDQIDSLVNKAETRLNDLRAQLARQAMDSSGPSAIFDALAGRSDSRSVTAAEEQAAAKRYDSLVALKTAFRQVSQAKRDEIRETAALAEADRALNEIRKEGRSNLDKFADSTRDARDAQNELKQAIIDAMSAGTMEDAQKELDNVAAASERFFSVLKENKLTLDTYNTELHVGYRDARNAATDAKNAVAGLVAQMQIQGLNQQQINAQLDEQKKKLIDNAVASGASRQEAERFFNEVFANTNTVLAQTQRFIIQNRDGITALGRKIDTDLRKKMSSVVDRSKITGELKKALDDFIAEPAQPKNIETLLNLGVAEADLRAFINNPTPNKFVKIVAQLDDSEARRKLLLLFASVASLRNDLDRASRDRKFQAAQQSRDAAGSANGRVVTAPMLSWLGEGYKPEVVIPLTKPKRAVQLYNESGLGDVLAKGGLNMSTGNTRNSNVTVNQTFNVGDDRNLRKASRKAMASGYDLARQLRGL